MTVTDDVDAARDTTDGLWIVMVLDRIHERLLDCRDGAGLKQLGHMSDEELIILANREIDTWGASS